MNIGNPCTAQIPHPPPNRIRVLPSSICSVDQVIYTTLLNGCLDSSQLGVLLKQSRTFRLIVRFPSGVCCCASSAVSYWGHRHLLLELSGTQSSRLSDKSAAQITSAMRSRVAMPQPCKTQRSVELSFTVRDSVFSFWSSSVHMSFGFSCLTQSWRGSFMTKCWRCVRIHLIFLSIYDPANTLGSSVSFLL